MREQRPFHDWVPPVPTTFIFDDDWVRPDYSTTFIFGESLALPINVNCSGNTKDYYENNGGQRFYPLSLEIPSSGRKFPYCLNRPSLYLLRIRRFPHYWDLHKATCSFTTLSRELRCQLAQQLLLKCLQLIQDKGKKSSNQRVPPVPTTFIFDDDWVRPDYSTTFIFGESLALPTDLVLFILAQRENFPSARIASHQSISTIESKPDFATQHI
ncbi:hypothetical protein RHGRI_034711 [Rhododendron griersonianum]|uniref:Uncharacterized protein n=1 Tax=Rhododendron griersonianum TaxID=479676 RepID=A0AAV6I1T2_9ERIC|nr:hypothetical protein RHGRI_034711 [Rhododendron griersonianum]